MKAIITVYRDSRKEWRWEMAASNGRIIGAATEGYKRRRRAAENLHAVTGCRLFLKDGGGTARVRAYLPRGRS